MFDDFNYNNGQCETKEFYGFGNVGNFSIGKDDFEVICDPINPDIIRGHGSHTSHSSK